VDARGRLLAVRSLVACAKAVVGMLLYAAKAAAGLPTSSKHLSPLSLRFTYVEIPMLRRGRLSQREGSFKVKRTAAAEATRRVQS